jgi:hypothetical protein
MIAKNANLHPVDHCPDGILVTFLNLEFDVSRLFVLLLEVRTCCTEQILGEDEHLGATFHNGLGSFEFKEPGVFVTIYEIRKKSRVY